MENEKVAGVHPRSEEIKGFATNKSACILLQAHKLEVFIYLILKRFNEAKGD